MLVSFLRPIVCYGLHVNATEEHPFRETTQGQTEKVSKIVHLTKVVSEIDICQLND